MVPELLAVFCKVQNEGIKRNQDVILAHLPDKFLPRLRVTPSLHEVASEVVPQVQIFDSEGAAVNATAASAATAQSLHVPGAQATYSGLSPSLGPVAPPSHTLHVPEFEDGPALRSETSRGHQPSLSYDASMSDRHATPFESTPTSASTLGRTPSRYASPPAGSVGIAYGTTTSAGLDEKVHPPPAQQQPSAQPGAHGNSDGGEAGVWCPLEQWLKTERHRNASAMLRSTFWLVRALCLGQNQSAVELFSEHFSFDALFACVRHKVLSAGLFAGALMW